MPRHRARHQAGSVRHDPAWHHVAVSLLSRAPGHEPRRAGLQDRPGKPRARTRKSSVHAANRSTSTPTKADIDATRAWTSLSPATPQAENPIVPSRHPAGSFFGDFRTPRGARNSSRKLTGSFWAPQSESRHSVLDPFETTSCCTQQPKAGVHIAPYSRKANSTADPANRALASSCSRL